VKKSVNYIIVASELEMGKGHSTIYLTTKLKDEKGRLVSS
jgi:hypothetical protein